MIQYITVMMVWIVRRRKKKKDDGAGNNNKDGGKWEIGIKNRAKRLLIQNNKNKWKRHNIHNIYPCQKIIIRNQFRPVMQNKCLSSVTYPSNKWS